MDGLLDSQLIGRIKVFKNNYPKLLLKNILSVVILSYLHNEYSILYFDILTLVLLNLDMPCLDKLCRQRSVGF